jgi:cell division protein FtsW (lipid II flippase)
MFGAVALLMLYFVLVARGLKIALSRDDGFSKLLAVGLTSTIALQAFIIVGGVTRLIPLTGITLPFVSYGGSSLVANFVLLALLVRVSATPRARAGPGRHRGRARRARAPASASASASAETTVVEPGGAEA